MTANESNPPKRNRTYWLEHTEQWKQSGLTKIAYCTQHSLKPVSFYNWSKKLENEKSESSPKQTKASFVSVQLDPTTLPLNPIVQVRRAQTHIDLPANLNNDRLNQWLQAIHALSV